MPLDSSRLASRLREVVRGNRSLPGTRDEVRPLGEQDLPPAAAGPRYVTDPDAGAEWTALDGCAVIERHYDLDFWHGRQPVGEYSERLTRSLGALGVLGASRHTAANRARRQGFAWDNEAEPQEPARAGDTTVAEPLLFFDLETTGLSGGAGTVAFLVGCGYFDRGGFHTKQLFLSGYEAEHDLLVALGALVPGFGGLVTYNGRTFDIPLIETRYLFHRMASPFEGAAHLDMLHPARRLWRRRNSRFGERDARQGSRNADVESCSLGSLEEAVLGLQREGDVPGFEIPSRYFHYLRTGDGSGLAAVFEHNRLDLISLAAITSIAIGMVDEGPGSARSPNESLALGQIFERADRSEVAAVCYQTAAGLGESPWEPRAIEAGLRAEALRRLALLQRRQQRFADAADAWRQLSEIESDHAFRGEATRALAIHHEHRARDLTVAREYAEEALKSARDDQEVRELRHRLSRLDRKLGHGPRAGLKDDPGA
jgi:uncharacterized protein YprB with RNaseH-like and TPR domain